MEVVANLVDNAIKFTPGGGHVRVEVTGPVTMAVVDDGIGLSEEERGCRRPSASTGPIAAGTCRAADLGLSLVAAIVELHGAALKVESRRARAADSRWCSGAEGSRV